MIETVLPLCLTLLTQTQTATASSSAVPPSFVKGELTHAGSVRLVPKSSFAGVRLGFLIQETTLFISVAPKLDLLLLDKKLRIGVEVPLNLELYSAREAADAMMGSEGFANAGRLREQDYDDPRDFVKLLREITYGRKEDNLYFSIGQLYATTIGHGQQMRRYAANVDINSTKVGAELDAYGSYGGFELTVADLTRASLFGMLAFIKPLAIFSDDWMAKSVSVGVSWVSDQKAPLALQRGDPVGAVPIGPVIVDEFLTPQTIPRAVNVYGVDAEIKLVKTESVDLKTYVDFSKLNNEGNGFTVGTLGRFNFRGESTLHLLRARLELRSYSADFQPSYFDVLYEFQKYAYLRDGTNPNPPTKLGYIGSREGPRRFGVYAEVSYALDDYFMIGAAIEGESEGEDQNLMLHVELPWDFIDIFATYQQRSFGNLFTLDQNDVIFAGARLQLLPFLFVNGRVQKNFAWDKAKFAGLGGYQENTSYLADVELGFEF